MLIKKRDSDADSTGKTGSHLESVHRSFDNGAAWYMFAGFALMVAVEFAHDLAEKRKAPHWIFILCYAVEHLGAVIVAAMLVRIGLEEAAQRRWLSEIRDAVRERVGTAFAELDKTVKAFDEKVKHIDSELEIIQTITGGNLYGIKLEGEGRREITRLLNSTFYRPQYNLILNLTPVGNEIIEVRIDANYQIENISKEKQEFIISVSLENVLYKGQASKPSRYERIEFGPDTPDGRRQAELQPMTFDAQDLLRLKDRDILKDVDEELVFDYRPGIKIAPEEKYFVKIIAVQQMRESDLFVWDMSVVTQEVSVVVNLEGSLDKQNFFVKMRPIDATKCQDLSDNTSQCSHKWKIIGPVLPKQGMRIWWSKRPE